MSEPTAIPRGGTAVTLDLDVSVKGKWDSKSTAAAGVTSEVRTIKQEAAVRIGELAIATGVSARALRYYEQQQLLTSTRSASGQRHYRHDSVERVRWIQQLYQAGLNSSAIAELLPCVHTGVVTAEMLDRLSAARNRIDQQVQELTATSARLEAVIIAALEHGEHASVSK